jgi:hypothetical protein
MYPIVVKYLKSRVVSTIVSTVDINACLINNKE